VKAPFIDIRITKTCDKCGFAEWKHHRNGDWWYCPLFQVDLTDRDGFIVDGLAYKNMCVPCDSCLALVRNYEELQK
jgi:hypothetical protein